MTRADVPISVSCDADRADGWHCTVVVGADAGATRHDVDLARATRDELAPGLDPETLIHASFVFLLEREPRESIMRAFELPVIGRFFPEYPDELRGRLR
jgi:hypothetical protein